MFRQKTSKRGVPPAPQEKAKKTKGKIQTRTQNPRLIANQVDAAEGKDLPEEVTTIQEEVEETEGGVYTATCHKGVIGHRE